MKTFKNYFGCVKNWRGRWHAVGNNNTNLNTARSTETYETF